MTQFETSEPDDNSSAETSVSKQKHIHQMRSNARISCHLAAHAIQDGFEIPCIITDISLGGAQVSFDTLSAQSVHDKPIVLDVPSIGKLPAIFRWRAGARGGVQFTQSELNKAALRKRLEELL